MMREEKLGTIRHYYNHLGVVAITLQGDIKIGDMIHVKGRTSDFTQRVDSIEIEHHKVRDAHKDDNVGIKVEVTAHEHDSVYKVVEDAA